MITIAHFYNKIISTQEILGGDKLHPHKNKNKNKSRKNNQGGVVEGGGTKREAINLHFLLVCAR